MFSSGQSQEAMRRGNTWVLLFLALVVFLTLQSFPLGPWAGATPAGAFLQAPDPSGPVHLAGWELAEEGTVALHSQLLGLAPETADCFSMTCGKSLEKP